MNALKEIDRFDKMLERHDGELIRKSSKQVDGNTVTTAFYRVGSKQYKQVIVREGTAIVSATHQEISAGTKGRPDVKALNRTGWRGPLLHPQYKQIVEELLKRPEYLGCSARDVVEDALDRLYREP